jgi:hypothetical protein
MKRITTCSMGASEGARSAPGADGGEHNGNICIMSSVWGERYKTTRRPMQSFWLGRIARRQSRAGRNEVMKKHLKRERNWGLTSCLAKSHSPRPATGPSNAIPAKVPEDSVPWMQFNFFGVIGRNGQPCDGMPSLAPSNEQRATSGGRHCASAIEPGAALPVCI